MKPFLLSEDCVKMVHFHSADLVIGKSLISGDLQGTKKFLLFLLLHVLVSVSCTGLLHHILVFASFIAKEPTTKKEGVDFYASPAVLFTRLQLVALE